MTNALRIGKRAFTWSVVATTIFWSMGLAALAPVVANAVTCPTLQAGDLFKVKGVSSVYLLDSAMKRLYFPHSSVYQTWYDNYSGVVEIPSSCVDAYPAPSAAPFGVNYRPGSRMVKVQISDSVYVVEPGNKISKIGSEAVAKDLYGTTWNKKIADIADVFWPNYANRGAEITEAVPHNGMVIKVSGSSDVYLVKDGKKFKVDGGFGEDVQTVAQAVADKVATEATTVTKASVTTNPSQTAGGAVVVTPPGTTPPGTTPPAAAGTLTIALAADTPSGTYAVDNSARVPFTKLNFTATGADVTVKSFKIKRGGSPAVNGDFDKVNVVDGSGNLLNDIGKTLNSDNEVTFTEDLVISAGATKTYTLVGDMVANVTGGNVPTLGLLSVETGATVVGSLPLYGNPVTTNTNVSLGTVTLTEGSTLANVTKQVGSNDVDLASLKISVVTNDFMVERLTFRNSSTTNDNDVQNFELLYNNNVIATGVMKDKYLSFDLKECKVDCKIAKGGDKTFTVRGDIVTGSGRSFDLDVQRATHVLAKDLKEGYYVTATNSATAMTNGITISQGKVNVTKLDTSVPTGNIPENATSVALAAFEFKVDGEPIDVRTLVLSVSTTGTVLPTGFDSVGLYKRVGTVDTALTGGIDAVGSNRYVEGYVTSTDTFTLTEGRHTIVVKGNIDSTPVDGDTVRISIDMGNTTQFDARGVNSSETITLGTYATPQSIVTGNVMTIKTAALRVTHLPTPATSTIAAGTSDRKLAEVQLDASGSTEDLKVTQFIIRDFADSGGTTISIQNIRLFVDKDGDSYNGAGTQEALGETKNGSDSTASNDETFTFNLSGADQFMVKAGKKVVVTVKGNIAGGAAAGNHVFKTTAGNDVTAVGVRTGSTVTETIDSSPSGNKITIGVSGGTVEVNIDPSNVTAKNYAGGTQGITLGIFNFLATTTENIEIESITFNQRVTDTASSSFQDYSLVYVVNDAGTVVAQAVPTSTALFLSFNADAFVVDANKVGGDKLTLKANLNSIGPQTGVSVGGHNLGYNISNVAQVIGKGDSTSVGSVEYFGGSAPNSVTHFMYRGVPTIDILSPSADSKLSSNADMFKFKVTANSNDIGLYKFTFDIATSGIAMSQVELVDITDPSAEVTLYSQSTSPAAGTGNAYYSGGIVVSTLLSSDNAAQGDDGEERAVAVSVPRTFVLRGTFGGGGVNASLSAGDNVTTRLAGDSASHSGQYNTLMINAGRVDADVQNDFIWSDRHATSTHATTTADFINGYLVNGLAAASSSAKVISL